MINSDKLNADIINQAKINDKSSFDFMLFKNLTASFGVGFEEYDISGIDGFRHIIRFEVGDDMVDGYSSFACTWEFNKNGKFIEMCIFE